MYWWEWVRSLYRLIRRGVIPREAVIYALVTLGCVLVAMVVYGCVVVIAQYIRRRLISQDKDECVVFEATIMQKKLAVGIDWEYWCARMAQPWWMVCVRGGVWYVQVLVVYVLSKWWW
jgi:hypothetical protein